MNPFYFIQFTDIHLGPSGLRQDQAEAAEKNFRVAIDEVNLLKPAFVLSTGDCAHTGKEGLLRYKELLQPLSIPVYSLPASHDIAIGPLGRESIELGNSYNFWEQTIGPRRQGFSCNGIRFILFEPYEKRDAGGWHSSVNKETMNWLKKELRLAGRQPIIIVFHSPITVLKDGHYAGTWHDTNVDEFLFLLSNYNIVAMITGHRHRDEEGKVGKFLQIQSGSLFGYQWNALPPHYWFPVRPGYRIFRLDGSQLHSFWRELRTDAQVNLVWAGQAHTMGPRPMVRPPIISSDVRLLAKAYGVKEKIIKVEYSLEDKKWYLMQKCFDKLWSEWEANFCIKGIEQGTHVLVVRAHTSKRIMAYDSIPLVINRDSLSVAAYPGPETVFELITFPFGLIGYGDFHNLPWRSVPYEQGKKI